ncbi:MAG: T9SS type A sorting domain-containing protein [Saprospiraceae bacterium]|nr:T9SS type A sorting domain-containing protein [Saprospiraceae bacterium]
MKYLFTNLILVLFFLFCNGLRAQDTLSTCIVDSAFFDSGILISPTPFVNDTLGDGIVAEACINKPYNVRFTVSAPSSIALIGIPVTVDSIRIDSVSNLPEGMTYECTDVNCIIVADSISCVFLTGTPTADNEPGEYILKIDLTVFTNILPLAISYPDPTLAPGSYILTLNEEGNPNCEDLTPIFDQEDLSLPILVFPNPTSDVLHFEYQDKSDWTRIEIWSAAGKKMLYQHQNGALDQGVSNIDVSKLNTGFYVFRLVDDRRVFNQKFFKR